LRRETDDAAKLFLKSSSIQDVADALEVHPGHLKFWLYTRPGHAGYKKFEIPKRKHGTRAIAVPPDSIKILQYKFKLMLDHVYTPKPCVFGFVAGKCIADGASLHKKRAKWILNIDIEDFYPSIHFGRIRGLFIALGVGPKAASIWAHLVTVDGVLPQGAPTSPVVSNMIARQLDRKMVGLARRYHLTYSRYADDLTLSTTKNTFPTEIASFTGTPLDADNVELKQGLLNAINSSGFSLNERKTRLHSKAVRQEVTGLTVNEFVNVRRRFLRQLRAMIHAANRYGFEAAGIEYIERYSSGRISLDILTDDGFDIAEYFKRVIYVRFSHLCGCG